ncbi:unnamed protein product [Scytosiphon promiscuus]
MAGVDAAAWMESFKEYIEPVAKVALDVKEQLESYDYPPAIVDAYKSAATAVGAEDISPVYVGVGVVAASGFLLLACRSCQAAPKKKKGRGSKKSKPKTKLAANGNSQKNGGSGKGSTVAADGATANGGSGTRGLPGNQPKVRAGGSKAPAQPVKKAPAKGTQPQGKGKGKGKPVPEAPPVITEEPEAATKKVSKKKEKAAKKAKEAAAATAAAAAKKASKKSSSAANGSVQAAAGSRHAHQNGGGGAGESDPWGAQHAGGEWQTGPIGPQEGEWETVSHKRSKPRKERTAVDDANAIPGGLGL